MLKNKQKFGFTLVELLVVIAIIALLSSIAITNLSVARAKARDAQRLRDLEAIRLALRLYYDDNGAYPEEVRDAGVAWESSLDDGTPFLQALVTGGYLSAVPVDPLNTCANCAGNERWYSANKNYIYDYQRRSIAPDGPQNSFWYCSGASNQDMYVLGVRRMETISQTDPQNHLNNHPANPGISCVGGEDFSLRFDWVVSNFSPVVR